MYDERYTRVVCASAYLPIIDNTVNIHLTAVATAKQIPASVMN